MIRTAYFAPNEIVPELSAVKRALLTYDRILLPDPSDRDYFPPQAFMMAMGMPPIFGMGTGSIRPLGKSRNYDEQYQILVDHLAPAFKEGVVDIVSTFSPESSNKLTIGAVDLGGFPVHPHSLLWLYRAAARDPDLLRSCILNDGELLSMSHDELSGLAIDQAMADGGINNDPALPDLEGELLHEEKRVPLSRIARARLASLIKSISFCVVKDLVPLFSTNGHIAPIAKMGEKSANAIDSAAYHDPYWTKRNRVLDLAYSEYLDDKSLEAIPTIDCLKFRTTHWGEQAKRRDELLDSAGELSKRYQDDKEFEKKVREDISDYRRWAAAVEKEREALRFGLKCDLLDIGSKAGLAGITAHTAGSLASLQTGIGALTFLLSACALSTPKIKDWSQTLKNLRDAEEHLSDPVCLSIHKFLK